MMKSTQKKTYNIDKERVWFGLFLRYFVASHELIAVQVEDNEWWILKFPHIAKEICHSTINNPQAIAFINFRMSNRD